jgi:enoyl-CoA hydratase/carnithine racemase
MPYRTMMEICLTGEPLRASDPAIETIVNYAVPAAELDAKTDWLVERITGKSPTGIRLGKQALSKIREMSTDSALEYAQFMLANMARTKDAREGFAAFNEKRAPNWTAE